MFKICVIQPVLTSYRDPVFRELNTLSGGHLMVAAETATRDFGTLREAPYDFCAFRWRKAGPLRLMPGSVFVRVLRQSDRIIHFADFKFLSLWLLLCTCLISRKKIWLHGQGGYKQQGRLQRLVYIAAILLADGYICYSKYSSDALRKKLPLFLHRKISVVENMLSIDYVEQPIAPDSPKRILYVGRLREGCGVELLLAAAEAIGIGAIIVGTGDGMFTRKLQAQYPFAQFKGAIFAQDALQLIAHGCIAGVYAGDAGLSVMQYMAMGLPVIVHDDLQQHMGPEPSHVRHDKNGLLFKRGDVDSLVAQLRAISENEALQKRLADASLDTFKRLSEPSMASQFYAIISA